MRIGYACIPLTLNFRTNRGFVLKNFSEEKFIEATYSNLKDLKLILEGNFKKDIYFFRISSDIIPFGSHNVNKIKWWDIFNDELKEIGDFIKKNNIRVSMHPGQYTVLNSTSKDVVEKSIGDIEYHTKFLDSLGVDYSNRIVLHVGGVYGDKKSAIDRFKSNFKLLSPSAQNRLIIENDEKMYSINDVLDICNDLKIPAVFDNLHHKHNGELNCDFNNLFKNIVSTWNEKDGKVKIHYSDEDYTKKNGAHSLFVNTENFIEYYKKIKPYDVDVMLEVKDKDISAIKCTNVIRWKYIEDDYKKREIITDEWNRYKYLIMERGDDIYKRGEELIKNTDDIIKIYKFIDSILETAIDNTSFIKTINNILKYFKDFLTKREINNFNKILKEDKLNYKKIKDKLYKLSEKYNVKLMLENYYFYY